MSDSEWDSEGETKGASMALSGVNLNSIKETYVERPNKVTEEASGIHASSENSHSAASFWGQTNNQNSHEEGDGNSTGYRGNRAGGSSSRGFGGNRGGGNRGGGVCYKCQEPGHMAYNCTNDAASKGSSSWGNNNDTNSGDRQYDQNNRQVRQGGRACFKCNEEGHMSRDCPSGSGGGTYNKNNGGSSNSRACFKCNEEGHISRDCPSGGGGGGTYDRNNGGSSNSRACFKCHEEGHMSRDCPSGGSGGTYDRNNGDSSNSRACFKCKEEGHRAFDCPNAPVGDNSRDGGKSGCFKCGDSSHMARDCTKTDEELKSMGIEVKPPPVTYIPVEMGDDDLFGQGVSVGNNFSAYANIPVKVSGKDTPKAINSFSSAGLRKMLLENVERAHYKVPTPIQKTAIPIIMNGRDIMGCAQTGSGKTAAYLLPILHYILENNIESFAYEEPMRLTALVLAPTRELAIQIYNEARKFAAGSILKICITYGGVSVSYQHKKFQEGCHVLVATPGRLMDFVNKDRLSFAALKFLVLDEADRMLDLGFSEDVKKIIAHSSTPVKEERQTLMFSATFSEEVQNLAKDFLNNYIFVVIGIVGAANADVKQTVIEIEAKDKRETLLQFLRDTLQKNKNEKILVFVATKRMADFLAAYMCQQEVSTTSIHGDRFQNQREEAINEFKNGIRNVLIATAVAARGLDIKGVGYVVNVDLPSDIDEYVHRIGRTGRVGNQGIAISYFDPAKDSNIAANLVRILNDAEQEVPDWLLEYTGGGTGGRETALFGAPKDIRKGLGFVSHETEYSSATHLGGPSNNTQEEDNWD